MCCSCSVTWSLREVHAGQAAMRKGLGRGAFICGLRRVLDSGTAAEVVCVAGAAPAAAKIRVLPWRVLGCHTEGITAGCATC